MQLFLKAFVVGLLTLAIVIPLALIGEIVRDRQAYRQQVVADIAANVGSAQTFAGPVLVVPFTETRTVSETDAQGRVATRVERKERKQVYFPEMLEINGTLPTSERARGIHVVRVYEWKGGAKASFNATLPASEQNVTRELSQPYLVYEFSDPRGLQGTPQLTVNGQVLKPLPGAGFRDGSGLHVRLPVPQAGGTLKLDTQLAIQLRGTQGFSVLPLGGDNRIDLSSDWNAPKFVGASPERDRVAKGFAAHWRVSALAANAQDDFLAGNPVSKRPALGESATIETEMPGRITIGLIDPVSAYSTTQRAIKYGLLFVAVTFAGFFLFEFLRNVPIHPIQYTLVGLAIAIFFLLLVSLSEHITFAWAYLAAAVACVGLITFYLSAVLRGLVPALGFTALLATLYGVLYGLLISEDNALVMGSALLFVLLAAIMMLTRKVDWYAISRQGGGWKLPGLSRREPAAQ